MSEPELAKSTPSWFRDAFYNYLKPTHDRSKRNEKWLWILLGITLTGQITNHWHSELWELVCHLFGIH